MSGDSTALTVVDYSDVTETWDLVATPEQISMMYTRYRSAAELAPGGAILEVGCGAGMGLPYLAENSRTIIGGDFTASLLKQAKTHAIGVPLVRLDAESLPFESGAFDSVLLLEMIYYLTNLPGALREAYRVLRPGGSVLITVPNPDRTDFNPSPHAIAYPDGATLDRLLTAAGFAAQVMGAFPNSLDSPRDRILAPIRHLAVKLHIIPKSMRFKALAKSLLYGRGHTVGQIRDGMAEFRPPTALSGSRVDPTFKVIYAIGRRH